MGEDNEALSHERNGGGTKRNAIGCGVDTQDDQFSSVGLRDPRRKGQIEKNITALGVPGRGRAIHSGQAAAGRKASLRPDVNRTKLQYPLHRVTCFA